MAFLSADNCQMEVGWFSARIGPSLSFTHIDHLVTPDVYEKYLTWLEDDIVTWTKGVPRGVLYHVPSTNKASANYRRRVAAVLAKHQDLLAEINSGFSMVTPSAIVRGFLTATFWLAPPGYPTHITGSLSDAFDWLAARIGPVSPAELRGGHQALLEEYQHLLSRSA